MKKIICDRCGKEVEDALELLNGGRTYDLCGKCDLAYNALWTQLEKEKGSKIKAWLEGK